MPRNPGCARVDAAGNVEPLDEDGAVEAGRIFRPDHDHPRLVRGGLCFGDLPVAVGAEVTHLAVSDRVLNLEEVLRTRITDGLEPHVDSERLHPVSSRGRGTHGGCLLYDALPRQRRRGQAPTCRRV